METAAQPLLLSVEEYLKFETEGQVRHEYIGGRIHAMAGTSEQHNLISGNMLAALHAHLRGGPCRVYMADFKVRLEINREDIFYYPDVMVSCVRDGVEKYYLRYAKLLVEVLSDSTEAIDRREKLIHYPQIPTLDEYAIVAQDKPEVTLLRRSEGWKPVVVSSLDAAAEFRSIQLSLKLAGIYERVF